ncbi:MAG: hypothetical protein WCA38_15280 [Candidatus Acidiferrales bacterium]
MAVVGVKVVLMVQEPLGESGALMQLLVCAKPAGGVMELMETVAAAPFVTVTV